MLLKSIDRSATCAWSPSGKNPGLIALGTVAGAIDDSFMATAQLEIASLDFAKRDTEMPILGCVTTNDRFHRLAWGTKGLDTGAHPYGLIAGGMVDGSVNIWNPAVIIGEGEGDALIAREEKHSGQVRGLEFNPYQPNLLASGAGDSEIFIWDLANPSAPSIYTPGTKTQPSADISCVAWNRKVQHILASTSYSGTSVVWDLKLKRPVVSFSDPYQRSRCSAVAWNPDVATQIVVATDDDRAPLLQVWDLRNALSPLKELVRPGLVGHTKGILSVSWCPNDSNLLLTCGKDNRTLCWNPSTGEIMCELPASMNWNFDVQWSPRIPAILSTASFDGKVSIYSLQDAGPALGQPGEPILSAEGFHIGTRPARAFTRAPKWLQRPAGASFAFGGKLVMFVPMKPTVAPDGSLRTTSQVQIHQVVTEPDLLSRSDLLDAALAEGGNLAGFCEHKMETSKSPHDREIWAFMKILFENDARRQMLAYLGYNSDLSQELKAVLDSAPFPPVVIPAPLPPRASVPVPPPLPTSASSPPAAPAPILQPLPPGSEESFFDDLAKSTVETSIAQPEEMNGALAPAADALSFGASDALAADGPTASVLTEEPVPAVENADEAASSSTTGTSAAAVDAFPIPDDIAKMDIATLRKKLAALSMKDSKAATNVAEAEAVMKKALIVGNFEAAVDVCLRYGRMGDALVLAACGGPQLWAKTQDAYFAQHTHAFMPVVAAVIHQRLQELVERADLSNWKETLALLCTYARTDAFPSLCDTLGGWLEREAGDLRSATLCYMCAANMEKSVRVWVANVGEEPFTPHDVLQDMIEKVCVFRKAVTNQTVPHVLADKFRQYAEILASQGRVAAAMHYLNIANEDPRMDSLPVAILRDRLYHNRGQRAGGNEPVPPFPFQPVNVATAAAPGPFETLGAGATYDYSQLQPQQASVQPFSATAGATYAQGQPSYPGAPTAGSAQPSIPGGSPPASSVPLPTYGAMAQGSIYPSQAPASAYSAPSAIPPPSTPARGPVPGTYGTSTAPSPPTYAPAGPPSAVGASSVYGAPTGTTPYTSPYASTMTAPPSNIPPVQPLPPSTFNPYATPAQPPSQPPQPPQSSAAPPPNIFQPHPQPPQSHPPSAPTAGPAPPTSAHSGQPPQAPSSTGGSSGGGAAPPAPSVTITTADTSNVAPDMQPVVQTLLNVYNRCASAATQRQAKLKIEDVSKRVGQLFQKLNARDVSPAVCEKLSHLCQALAHGDFKTATDIQVQLTTTDWDEHGTWIVGVKRLIEACKAPA